eukprot:TRINITY_DN286_c0_g1_i10.p1 TRINITY_DN286_c0_g1~~TRINITY_DN286_c0_g1_i10.p1  ORF type:complete len:248 (+),score=65.08 TRINITY_DN286_c0_g1_i10:66-809(+)
MCIRDRYQRRVHGEFRKMKAPMFMPQFPFPFFPGNAAPKPPIATHLLRLFRPRLNIEYVPGEKRSRCRSLDGILDNRRDYLQMFEEEDPPEATRGETKEEKRKRRYFEKLETHKTDLKDRSKEYVPADDPNVEGDPYKTIIVARLNYETTEKTLKKEFERYGPVKRVRIVRDPKTEKSRGYGFVEFEKVEDFKTAYKQANERRIDGRKVVVDYERGRTIAGWLPKRLGGGLGDTRNTTPSFLKGAVR